MIFLQATQAAKPDHVEIIAHRGASQDAPENTLEALRLGFEQGADAGELDVWMSQDGQAMVIHDSDTKRVTAKSKHPNDKKVAEQTAQELNALDVGSWKNQRFAGAKIPTLEQALKTVPPGKRMYVELKCGVEGVPEVLRVLNASSLKPEQTPIISFHAPVIAAVKKARPDLPAYWIVSIKDKPGKDGSPITKVEDLIEKSQSIQADGLDVSGSPLVDEVFVSKVRTAKLRLYTWTIDQPELARRLVALGVDGITTNRPGWLREQLAAPH